MLVDMYINTVTIYRDLDSRTAQQTEMNNSSLRHLILIFHIYICIWTSTASLSRSHLEMLHVSAKLYRKIFSPWSIFTSNATMIHCVYQCTTRDFCFQAAMLDPVLELCACSNRTVVSEVWGLDNIIVHGVNIHRSGMLRPFMFWKKVII